MCGQAAAAGDSSEAKPWHELLWEAYSTQKTPVDPRGDYLAYLEQAGAGDDGGGDGARR